MLQYTLETFCEGRYTSRNSIPYGGGAVDGPYNGQPPKPWDMKCSPKAMFCNETIALRVPHTSEIKVITLCILPRFCNQCYLSSKQMYCMPR